MTPKETGELLVLAALIDNRNVTFEAARMWHKIVGHIDYADAVQAMEDHFRDSTEYLLPAHIVEGARRVREMRPPTPPAAIEGPSDEERRRDGIRQYLALCEVTEAEFAALVEQVGFASAIFQIGDKVDQR